MNWGYTFSSCCISERQHFNCWVLIFGILFGIYLACLEQAEHLIQNPYVPKHISLSLFDKMNCFQLFPRSFQDFSWQPLSKSSCFWYHWYVWNKHDTLQCPNTSLCLLLSLFNKMNQFQLLPCAFWLFSSQLYLKLCVQRRSVFVPTLPIMSCVPTYRAPSSHDITQAGSHHHRVVGVGNHGSGMPVTQGGGTAIWLGNCFVPDICGKQAECHFKQ